MGSQLLADALTLAGIRPPPSLWQSGDSSNTKLQNSKQHYNYSTAADRVLMLPAKESAKRIERLSSLCSNETVLQLFDEIAWQLVVDLHEEDMRRGGLERIFPTCSSARYVQYFERESYADL